MPDFDAKQFLTHCSRRPGVYRMLDGAGTVLYVGKARDLRARLNSYFQKNVASAKTRALVARIAAIETTVTGSEAEALLLEQSLIKALHPPYNILLRDDKSYPYIKVTTADEYPRITLHRGKKRPGSQYFGPYPSAGSVRETLALIEKVFRVRNCRDSFFRNRSRPCLQYQIQRCTAPCVGFVSKEDYAEQVRLAMEFLSGQGRQVSRQLTVAMEQAAANLDFERAAELRDQLAAIQAVQQRQHVQTDGGSNVDALGIQVRHGLAVVEVLMVRQGRILGHRSFQPDTRGEDDPVEVLEAFVAQYYLGERDEQSIPQEILLPHELPGGAALQEALAAHLGRRIRVAWRVRGERQAWLRMAASNAVQSLEADLAAREHMEERFLALETLLEGNSIRRIECFDISHTQGERAVASCVVFDQQGSRKTDYRHFNVNPDVGGDDYQAIEEAVRRRYQRVVREEGKLPDLLLIDGGRGQTQRAFEVIQELQLEDKLRVMGIGKGPSRRPGLEVLYLTDGRELVPGESHSALHLLQQVRDEAHRFAITGHRARRGKARRSSGLEEIPGIGPKRRKALLSHFGGLKQLRNASLEELSRVDGISAQTAETLYNWFHG